jgi:ribose-phosphate pyrophosphokinase
MSGMRPAAGLVLFALEAARPLGEAVARALEVPLGAHEERLFEDGEHKLRPLEPVRDREVYVIQSLCGDARASVNDRLVRLLHFLACLKDHGAARVTAVLPYLAYARKDRRTQPHDPVTLRYTAQLFEASGVDRLLALEVHNPAAFDNAFRVPAVHLEAGELFALALVPRLRETPVAVVSPDVGGVKRAERFQHALEAALGQKTAFAFLEKARGGGELRLGRLVGEVAGATVVLYDDLISTGRTLVHAARACLAAGARAVYAAAAHGVFAPTAGEVLAAPELAHLYVSDSVGDPASRLAGVAVARAKLSVLPCAPLLAAAIRAASREATPRHEKGAA